MNKCIFRFYTFRAVAHVSNRFMSRHLSHGSQRWRAVGFEDQARKGGNRFYSPLAPPSDKFTEESVVQKSWCGSRIVMFLEEGEEEEHYLCYILCRIIWHCSVQQSAGAEHTDKQPRVNTECSKSIWTRDTTGTRWRFNRPTQRVGLKCVMRTLTKDKYKG